GIVVPDGVSFVFAGSPTGVSVISVVGSTGISVVPVGVSVVSVVGSTGISVVPVGVSVVFVVGSIGVSVELSDVVQVVEITEEVLLHLLVIVRLPSDTSTKEIKRRRYSWYRIVNDDV